MAEVIAIDGPAASGKSTVASRLAAALNIAYVNTGNMFRAVTRAAQAAGITTPEACTDENLAPVLAGLQMTYKRNSEGVFDLEVNGEFPGAALRDPEIARLVSPVATVGCVRTYLKELQRSFAADGMLVMEGRDIGTVVFPDARWKFFITATPEERARRRLAQSGENVSGATIEEVAKGIAERDRIDSTRAIAPLRAAEDAETIDTTGLSIDDVVNHILKKVQG